MTDKSPVPTPPPTKSSQVNEENNPGPPEDVPFGPPKHPTPEELPPVVVAPAAIDPTAVETTASGLKFGWQQPATRPEKALASCMHTGIFQARKQVAAHEVGHEWACICGVIFVVTINTGDKKVLSETDKHVG